MMKSVLFGLFVVMMVIAGCDSGSGVGGGAGDTTGGNGGGNVGGDDTTGGGNGGDGGGSGSPTAITGTWTGTADGNVLTIGNTNWECVNGDGNYYRGTYTFGGNTGAFTITHIKASAGSAWEAASGTGIGTVTGNTLTIIFTWTSPFTDTISLVFTKPGGNGTGTGGGDTSTSTAGRLTITGLWAYNGAFAMVMGINDGGQGKITVEGGKVTGNVMDEAIAISNGQVVIPLYTYEYVNGYGGKYFLYTGNHVLDVCVNILPSKTVDGGWEINKGNSVKFSNGIGTLDYPQVIDRR
jgi:hypothetical protein